MDAGGVEPVDSLEGRELDLVDGAPGLARLNEFGHVDGVDGRRHRVAVGAADGSNRAGDAELNQAVGAGQAYVLRPTVRVIHQSMCRGVHEHGNLQRLQPQRLLRQGPGPWPPNNPAGEHVGTERCVGEARRGRDVGALRDPQLSRTTVSKRRWTRSARRVPAGSDKVVSIFFLLVAPLKPAARMSFANGSRPIAQPTRAIA